jgi:hypothetical protein
MNCELCGESINEGSWHESPAIEGDVEEYDCHECGKMYDEFPGNDWGSE